MTWCCKAEPNLAEQARDRLWEKQLSTSSGTPMNWDLPLSSVPWFSDAPSSCSQRWALGAGSPPAQDGASSDVSDIHVTVLPLSPAPRAIIAMGQHWSLWPCWYSAIPLWLFQMSCPSGPWTTWGSCQWACHLWATTLSLFVSALGPTFPCHLKLWRGA